MNKIVELICSQDQFEELHRVLEKAKGKGEFVKVNREALTKLFVDHSRLLQAVPHKQKETTNG